MVPLWHHVLITELYILFIMEMTYPFVNIDLQCSVVVGKQIVIGEA